MNASGLAEGKIDVTRENTRGSIPHEKGPAIRLRPDSAYHTTQVQGFGTALSGRQSRGHRRRATKDKKELSTKGHEDSRRDTKGFEESLAP